MASEVPLRGPHEPGVRAGRFHTARGPMPLSGWLRFPAAWLRGRSGRTPERPWIVPAAIGWLRRRIKGDWSVLELGAGRSTPWLARRAGRVVSFEDNELWLRRTAETLEREGLEVDLRLMPVEAFVEAVAALPDAGFDLVILDFLESPQVTRVDVLRPARDKVRPGGLLLLDDSDRPGYAEAYELVAGWREHRFAGVKDGWPQVCETAVFRRPS
ncbi:MAG: class I SAM-dependent methyltransferase [Solirubrobacterales bacterium]